MSEPHDFIVLRDHGLVELAERPYRYIEIEKPWLQGRWRCRYWFVDGDWTDDQVDEWAKTEFVCVEVVWQMNLPF